MNKLKLPPFLSFRNMSVHFWDTPIRNINCGQCMWMFPDASQRRKARSLSLHAACALWQLKEATATVSSSYSPFVSLVFMMQRSVRRQGSCQWQRLFQRTHKFAAKFQMRDSGGCDLSRRWAKEQSVSAFLQGRREGYFHKWRLSM